MLSAADFFEVEVLSLGGLQRYGVMGIMELSTRRVTISGIIAEPTGQWVPGRDRRRALPTRIRGEDFNAIL